MIRPNSVTPEQICEEVRSYHRKQATLWGVGIVIFVVLCTIIFVALKDNGVTKIPAMILFVVGLVFFLWLFITNIMALFNLERNALLKYYGPPFVLANAIREGAEDVIFRDSNLIITKKYILYKDLVINRWVTGYLPLRDILLFFGFYNDQDPSIRMLRCVDEYGIEHQFTCKDPWEACRAMMPYMSGKARYGEEEAEILAIMDEIHQYAKENKRK